MSPIAFQVRSRIDRLLASPECRRNANLRASHALQVHGSRSIETLLRKLNDPRRSKSRREIRLAMAEIVKFRAS